MFSIRQKLMLGFGGLLVIVAVIGVMTILQIRHLGEAIDVILRENYRSVVACQEMKEGARARRQRDCLHVSGARMPMAGARSRPARSGSRRP